MNEELRPQLNLQERIWDELQSGDDTADVLAWVDDVAVTLSGSVTSYPVRAAVEQMVRRVPGVGAVVNELSVVLPERECEACFGLGDAAALHP
jgi:hypothetical protein